MLYHATSPGSMNVKFKYTDFNGADATIQNGYAAQWTDLENVLRGMPLHLKASEQDGIQGSAVFDPVGVNDYIAQALKGNGWSGKIPIPDAFESFGADVDFAKQGMVVEVQFSNYPFLLNNTIRSEMFFRAGTVFHGAPTGIVVIVTKSGMFPSSNSSLYYEQAINQLTALVAQSVFTVPLRLVGLYEEPGQVNATWTGYPGRTSRTVLARETRTATITQGASTKARITF